MGPAAFPLADHVFALRDQVGGAPEVQVREGGAELLCERADRLPALKRGVQRVLEPDVTGCELVDDGRLKSLPQNSVNHRPTTALLSSIDIGDAFLTVNWVGAHSGGTCYADGRESRLVRCGLGLACRIPSSAPTTGAPGGHGRRWARRRVRSRARSACGPGTLPISSQTRRSNWCLPQGQFQHFLGPRCERYRARDGYPAIGR